MNAWGGRKWIYTCIYTSDCLKFPHLFREGWWGQWCLDLHVCHPLHNMHPVPENAMHLKALYAYNLIWSITIESSFLQASFFSVTRVPTIPGTAQRVSDVRPMVAVSDQILLLRLDGSRSCLSVYICSPFCCCGPLACNAGGHWIYCNSSDSSRSNLALFGMRGCNSAFLTPGAAFDYP